MTSTVLSQLRASKYERSDTTPFESQIAFQAWADCVAPLLSFDKSIQSAFKSAVATVDVLSEEHGIDLPVRAVNEAIGRLNQGIAVLALSEAANEETGNPLRTVPLDPPSKVPLRWLFDHVPALLVVGGVSLLAATFALGIAFSQTQLYQLVKVTVGR